MMLLWQFYKKMLCVMRLVHAPKLPTCIWRKEYS